MKTLKKSLALTIIGLSGFSFSQDSNACDRYRQATVLYYPTVHASVPAVPVGYPAATVTPTQQAIVQQVSTVQVHQVSTVQVKEAVRRSQLVVGTTIRMNTRFAGNDRGAVFLTVGNVKIECSVLDWNANQISFSVPAIGLGGDTGGTVSLVRANGSLLREIPVTLVSDQDQFETIDVRVAVPAAAPANAATAAAFSPNPAQ